METTRKRAPGAGRPRTLPDGATKRSCLATDEEWSAMTALMRRMRSGDATPPEPLFVLMRGMDAAQAHRPATGCIYLSVGDDGRWTAHGAPMADEVQLMVPAIGPVELFDDRSE